MAGASEQSSPDGAAVGPVPGGSSADQPPGTSESPDAAANGPAAAEPAGGAEPDADRGTVPADDGPTVRLSADDGPTVPLPGDDETVPIPAPEPPERVGPVSAVRRLLPRLTAANAMIGVLLALLGFTLAVQLRTNSTDASLETTRQEDLVRILSDLDAQEERVRQDIAALEESQRQLNSGAEGRQAALDEATRRADELGILAGTLPARGPGLTVSFMPVSKPIAASRVLDAVQELRGAGAEAMQISGGDGATVRIIASTYFLDADGGISVSGRRLTGPYMISVIGDPKTMQTALNIPGGVVASVSGDGGNVAIQEREVVDVTALSPPKDLQHARPVS
ncbi:DUF881 domain-containing protein [Plantactinospora sp. KLBMP9567]|uniref:DUF881 domain-containing protein n=1 Tax=Plantactinospora sp. KLBMP9567 TaxID=3085900 RepID=UPI002982A232|nr:DUF881 domain-containing protein [Plantactinospora sp. KLBMP9567]MDW5325766.1 DUF881 domain-containing protein [Plantactinospora sp. KLBMP9567]